MQETAMGALLINGKQGGGVKPIGESVLRKGGLRSDPFPLEPQNEEGQGIAGGGGESV